MAFGVESPPDNVGGEKDIHCDFAVVTRRNQPVNSSPRDELPAHCEALDGTWE